jgi:hypothetical protein
MPAGTPPPGFWSAPLTATVSLTGLTRAKAGPAEVECGGAQAWTRPREAALQGWVQPIRQRRRNP